MKPPVPYFGGKITLGPKIAEVLPPHRHYVEPYCGSLAVLLAKPVSPHETVNDLDHHLMTFWRVLRDRPEELAHAVALTPHSRAEHQLSYELDDVPDDLEVSRRLFVQLTQGRAGTRRRTGWRHYVKPKGYTSMPDYLVGYLERILPAAERLAAVSLESQPALDLIVKYGADPDVLLYCDPPYLGSTRSKSWDGYVHEMRAEADHQELAEVLHTAQASVVLSGYASPMHDGLYADWNRIEFSSFTGQVGTWTNRTEVLWANCDLAFEATA
jgi:DNA adenine methylase